MVWFRLYREDGTSAWLHNASQKAADWSAARVKTIRNLPKLLSLPHLLLCLAHLQELLRVEQLLLGMHVLETGDQPRHLVLVRLHHSLSLRLLESE